MITVWKTPIAASVEQILRDLKLMLFAEGLLRDQNNTGSDVMVTCPFHKGGHERKPSCGVSLKEKITPDKTYEAGTVHCYTCGYTADLPTFISDSAQKTPAVRKNVRGMNAPITNNATIIPTGFSSGIVGFSWPDVLQNAVIRCIALLFQEKHFR